MQQNHPARCSKVSLKNIKFRMKRLWMPIIKIISLTYKNNQQKAMKMQKTLKNEMKKNDFLAN